MLGAQGSVHRGATSTSPAGRCRPLFITEILPREPGAAEWTFWRTSVPDELQRMMLEVVFDNWRRRTATGKPRARGLWQQGR